MARQPFFIVATAVLLLAGCVCCKDPLPSTCESCIDPLDDPCQALVANIEYPDVDRCDQSLTLGSGPPRRMSEGVPTEFWDLSLDEAIRTALQNSRILRDLGGRVLTSPQSVRSIYDPSITMTHPRFGEEAALAAFDAQYQESFVYSDAHQIFNNATLGGGATEVSSDGFSSSSQLSKIAATGTQFSLSRLLRYENSDAPFNLFPSAYTGALQATIRQPLLQGSGVALNRIAGPRSQVDLTLTRGVILARIDGDISIAAFERGVRDFVRDVETAYWQLYFAYRALDAFRSGRDSSRVTWETVKARNDADLRGGEADQEAQAREQLYQFEQRVVQSLNGSSTGLPGLYQAERRLRRMMGLPITDERLIRPNDEPIDTPVTYDWHDCLADALVRRVELREQMWRVKQRELELIAAKNFLLPRFDAVASYRIDGFGDDLASGGGPFETLSRELFSFDNYQSQLGLQLAVPLGFRRELAGVRHSELNLCRERALLQDQEHLVSVNLGEAFVAVETAYESIKLNHERLIAAEETVAARKALLDAGKVNINFLLDSQRRLADAQVSYFQSRIDHALAIRNLHYEKGTLLPFNGVRLQEGPWPSEACEQAWYERRRWMDKKHGYRKMVPGPITLGPFSTQIETGSPAEGAESAERLPDNVTPKPEEPLNDSASELELLPTPQLNQPVPVNEGVLIDEPGPGANDPDSPGPAGITSEKTPNSTAATVAAVTYLQELLDHRVAYGSKRQEPPPATVD